MSAAILDRARAFDILAQHMSPERVTEIADALAAEIIPASKKRGAQAASPFCPAHPDGTDEPCKACGDRRGRADTPPDPEHLKFEETAKFLADHGYSSADQVRAAGRLEEFLKKNPNLTREAGMRAWLGRERGAER